MPQTLSDIKALLAARGIHPRKRFGQNFLIDHHKLADIIAAAELSPGERVLEVGPGTGVLTEALLDAGAAVTAIEMDRDMCAILRERMGERGSFTLIEGDAMASKHAINPEAAATLSQPFKLIANLPYHIASPLIATLVLDYPMLRGAVVMVQHEVGERLMARGGKDCGPLSIVVHSGCEVKRVAVLSPGCFWPAPQVDSAVIRLRRRAQALTDDPHGLAKLAQQLFQKRRKQIGSILGRDTPLPDGVDATMRPEQLNIEQMVMIQKLTAAGG